MAAPRSRAERLKPLDAVRQVVLKPTDARAELDEDNRIGIRIPLRFAVAETVSITPATHGTWEEVPGGRIWRLRVVSDGATDLNFGFSDCHIPAGATLHISSEGEDYFQGPYTARDDKPHGEFWSPVIPGHRAVIELFVPAEAREEARITLAQVNRGYRDMFHRQKDLAGGKAGACNIDSVCPQGDPWRDDIRSVARYSVNGTSLCTGSLVNNANQDNRNFFLTANHCGITPGNAASVVVYWNFQSPACGQHGGGSLAQNQNGSIFRMSRFDVDMTLIELEDIPDSSFNVYYAGWDRATTAPSGVAGIHHPNGDEKSLCFSANPVTSVNSCIGTGGSGTHWNVVWSSGVTEQGSSGSGIWDAVTHRIVGTLSGGGSSCSTPFLPDCYGKVSSSWNLGTTPATRLRDWLDPSNTGILFVNGRNPGPVIPPVVYTNFVLSRDFSTNLNPNGVWSCGWKSTFTSTFNLLSQAYGAFSDNGVRIQGWVLPTFGQPAVYQNPSPDTTAILGGGQGVLPPGTVYFHPGLNGRAENFGVIRFVAPSNSNYIIDTVATPLYSGGLSGDTDFHVLKNGVELFGQFLPARTGTSYSNLLTLAAGEALEFAIGRGADGNEFGADLKMSVVITPTLQTTPTAANIVGVSAALVTENCSPTNRAIDPGEAVAVSYTLRNVGTANGTVIATLLPSAQVISPGPAQNYGILLTNGTPVTRTFTYTAGGTCGGTLTNRLQIQVNGSNAGTLSFTFNQGVQVTRLNEHFDSVRPPALPANWINSASGATTGWATTSNAFGSPNNSVFAADPTSPSDASLTSPTFLVTSTNSQLSFMHRYHTEYGFDGGVLEYSINGGPFIDFIEGGGSFLANGYNSILDTGFGSPMPGRAAWTGNSTNFVTTVASFPPSVPGHYMRLRWRIASDSSEARPGWNVDSILVTDTSCCSGPLPPVILNTHREGGSIVFSYDSRLGQNYFIEYKDSLSTPTWTTLRTDSGDGSSKWVTNAVTSRRFYRLRTQ